MSTHAPIAAPRGGTVPRPRSKSRNGVRYTVVADDIACGFPPEGPDVDGPETRLWEEFFGRKGVFGG